MKIRGVASTDVWDVTEKRSYSEIEVYELLKEGRHSIFVTVPRCTIAGEPYWGTSFTLWDETYAPILREGKVILKTYLSPSFKVGETVRCEPKKAQVIIDPKETLFISILRTHMSQS